MSGKIFIAAAVAAALSGCMQPLKPSTAPSRQPSTSQLPTILIDQIVIDRTSDSLNTDIPVRGVATSERRITITASNADIREILPAIAAAGGINLVMSPGVQGRVSVRFVDVPVSVALNNIIEEAGLTLGSGKLESPWKPVVFYGAPVNVNLASAQLIASRFGVSDRLANLIVESRNDMTKGW